MRRARNSQGFTIVEVMVMAVVGLIVTGILFEFFVTAAHRTEDSRVRVDLQQNGINVLRYIERDLSLTSIHGIAVAEGTPYVISITRVADWTPAPGVRWEKEQTLYEYDKDKKTLTMESYPPKAPTYSDDLSELAPYLPTAAELQAVATTPGGKERILSSSIEEFKLTDRNGSTTQFQAMPLKLEMKFRRKLTTADRYAEFTVERRFSLRNAF